MGSTPSSTSSTTEPSSTTESPAAAERRRGRRGTRTAESAAASLLEVGRIGRPHGTAGEVVVHLWTNRPERLEPGSRLWDGDEWLVVRGVRTVGGRHVVRFEGMADRSGAELRRGRVLQASPILDPGALWVHEIIGAEVATTSGEVVGVVTAVEANPASDLLVVDGGHLVPLAFVVEVVNEDDARRVVIDAPPGLLG